MSPCRWVRVGVDGWGGVREGPGWDQRDTKHVSIGLEHGCRLYY